MTHIAANDGPNLDDPITARKYISNFKYILGREATYVTTNEGRLIHFRNMNDEDACFVAHQLRHIESEAKKK